jgi:YfiH family protein
VSPDLIELESRSVDDTVLLSFPALNQVNGFSHAITTKPWNMSLRQGLQVDRAVARRRRVCEVLRLPFEKLTAADQVHSPHVLRVRPADAGAGREIRDTAIRHCDGLVCDLPGVALTQFSADCPIIVVVEPRRRILGTAHASWRGTVAGIASELIRQLRREFKVDPADLLGGICPCAGPDEYEVGDDVRRIALARLDDADQYFKTARSDVVPSGIEAGRVPARKWYFDMRAANASQLVAAGLAANRIQIARPSTLSDPRFYSHRRDGASAGRFALIAGFAE